MPQIWPMNWLVLFLFFLLCFITFMTVMYFNIPLQSEKSNIKSIKSPSLTWEW
uniref:ATP synthase complex subunit 8 n=1 Tax=Diaphanosoma excisum TaxID=2094052 RepID=A0A8A1RXK8_9CRUS|nr:ATP synthase F0 subunit 8 [Diaphanosoma excisum]QST19917.1 ATP synthase F0 subunit 8 [Diaphanosoma excisum]